MKSKITLTGMEFYAYHGCFAEEKRIGTRFKVSLALYCDVTEAAKSDDLNRTVNYQAVYAEVKKIMENPVDILESLCYSIITQVKKKFPLVEKAEVVVSKLNPAIGGKTESVSVTMEG